MRVLILDSDSGFVAKLGGMLEKTGIDWSPLPARHLTPARLLTGEAKEHTIFLLGPNLEDVPRKRFLDFLFAQPPGHAVYAIVSKKVMDELALLVGRENVEFQFLPFRAEEFVGRLALLVRRAYPELIDHLTITCGSFVLSRYPNRVSRDGVEISLSRREFDLAYMFFGHLGQPVSRITIEEMIWGEVRNENSRTIDTHVSRVRNKLGLFEENGFELRQVYAYGYQLVRLD